jgi:hypothetical protein
MAVIRKASANVSLRKQCRNYLGKLGCYMFLEFSALAYPRTLRKAPEVASKRGQPGASMLLRWTQAAMPGTRNDPGLKALISTWGKMQRGHVDHTRTTRGFEFVVSNTMVTSADQYRDWHGSLILIYERKTESLFHHIVEVATSTGTPSNLIWFAVGRAMKVIENAGISIELLSEKRTVLFPSCSLGKPINHAFREASARFEIAKKKDEEFKGVWLKDHVEFFDTDIWEQGWYIGRPHFEITLEMSGANELRRQMQEVATAVSKYFRQCKKSMRSDASASGDTARPSWQGLNAARAKERKAPDRFDR